MSLHNIFLQRMTLENQDVLTGPDFDKTFNAMYEMATKNIEKQRQAKIEQEEIARNNDQIMASINGGPNTNSEKFIKKTSFSSDAKGRLIPKVTIEERTQRELDPIQIVDTTTGEVTTIGETPKGSRVFTKKPEREDMNIYTIDPITGEMTQTASAPYGSKVYKGVMSPGDIQERAEATGRGKAIEENVKTTAKLSNAVSRLSVLNKQFNKALPAGDKTPIEQRISGNVETWAAKAGLVNNPELVALQKNIRPIAIQMIRAFGEVGNLSESEQQGAIDVITMSGINEEERAASVKQFIEFALAGASPESIRYIKDRKDIQGILDAYGVDLSSYGENKDLIDSNSGININNIFSGLGGL